MSQDTAWLGEPPEWRTEGSMLHVRTEARTDFWCRTLQDQMNTGDFATLGLDPGEYVVDSGHFYFDMVAGDFSVTVKVSGEFSDQYDQAGLFIRHDSREWLKVGIELVDGKWADRYPYRGTALLVGATVTRGGWSDWSVLPQFDHNPPAVWFRVTRQGRTGYVDFSLDGEEYRLMRVLSFPDVAELKVGRYASSPTGEGFIALFDEYLLLQTDRHGSQSSTPTV